MLIFEVTKITRTKYSIFMNEKKIIKALVFLNLCLVIFSCSQKPSIKKISTKDTKATNTYSLTIESPAEFSATLVTKDLYDQNHHKISLMLFDSLDTVGRLWQLTIKGSQDFRLDTTLRVKSLIDFKKFMANSFLKIPAKKAQNANFTWGNNTFIPVEAIEGNELVIDQLNEFIGQAIGSNKTKIVLERDRFYKKPRYLLSSEKSIQGLKDLEKCLRTKITLKLMSDDIKIDKSIFASWLTLDSNMNVSILKSKSNAFINELCSKYDEIIPSVRFTNSKLEEKVIQGGDIGVRISVFKELNQLLIDIKSGGDIEREPIYGMKGLPPGVFDSNKTYVEISISDQKLWYYKNGELMVESNIVTGCVRQNHATPKGAYYVKYKESNTKLQGPGYSASVRFWMPFNKGIGLHDASWRQRFGENIYLSEGSHGCINLPRETAQIIYQNISPGTIVLCY